MHHGRLIANSLMTIGDWPNPSDEKAHVVRSGEKKKVVLVSSTLEIQENVENTRTVRDNYETKEDLCPVLISERTSPCEEMSLPTEVCFTGMTR